MTHSLIKRQDGQGRNLIHNIDSLKKKTMKPDLQMKVDKYFRQCVGIDVAKDTFMACLSMLDIATDEGKSSQTVEFANNKHGFNQLVK